ncbi:MAG: T9SS type A sorting domain-containing protein [Bacteroidota bacterium]|nr:T9SS type A sorting domain-containing protein [Bacteroidota bacterium]
MKLSLRYFCSLVSCIFLSEALLTAQNPTWVMAKQIQTTCNSNASIATDQNNNIYMGGYFETDTLVLANDTLFNTGLWSMYLARYDGTGNLQWGRGVLPSNQINEIMAIGTDLSGNIYASGYYRGSSIVVGQYVLSDNPNNNFNIFIIKYDLTGNIKWARNAIAINNSFYQINSTRVLSVDGNGNVHLAGEFSCAELIFGTDTLRNNGPVSSKQSFHVTYDSAGNIIKVAPPSRSSTNVILKAPENTFYAGGSFRDSLVCGPYILHADTHFASMFIVKYNNSGNVEWAKKAQNSDNKLIQADHDASGNIYLLGYCFSSMTFEGITLPVGGTWMAKMNSSGNLIWLKRIIENIGSTTISICVKPDGKIFISGYFPGSRFWIGTDTIKTNANPGLPDIYLAAFNADGNLLWLKGVKGGKSGKNVKGMKLIQNRLLITGTYSEYAVFGSDSLFWPEWIKNGGSRPYLAKLDQISGMDDDHEITTYPFIYPNPAANHFFIHGSSNGFVSLSIYNITGQKMYATEKYVESDGIDIRNLGPGLYFIRLEMEKGIRVDKLIKDGY